MKKKLLTAILAVWFLIGYLAAQADQDIFEKAKGLIFDKQWATALKLLNEVVDRFPNSRYYASALFYRAKCQEELAAGKPALESYEKFIKASAGSNLAEEARISIIDLAAALYLAGEKVYLQKILGLLNNENKVVAYYAAFKLSYLPDRNASAQALPVLERILEKEKDAELRDRAEIAVMRIDPSRLKGMDRPEKSTAGRVLKIRILDKKDKAATVMLNIPLALADLALKSLSDEQKRTLQKKGYNLDDILANLTSKGLKIDIQDDDSAIQIWVE
jgi:hypothetical protein